MALNAFWSPNVYGHVELPFCGAISAYINGTSAAARGGITTMMVEA